MQALPPAAVQLDEIGRPQSLSLSEQLGKAASEHCRRGKPKKALLCLKRALDVAWFARPNQHPQLVLDRIRARLGLCAILSKMEHHREAMMHASEARNEAEVLLSALPECWDLPPDNGGFSDEAHAVRFACEVDHCCSTASHCIAIENAFMGGEVPDFFKRETSGGWSQSSGSKSPDALNSGARKTKFGKSKTTPGELESGPHPSTKTDFGKTLLPPLKEQHAGVRPAAEPAVKQGQLFGRSKACSLPDIQQKGGEPADTAPLFDIPIITLSELEEANEVAEAARRNANEAMKKANDFMSSLGGPLSRKTDFGRQLTRSSFDDAKLAKSDSNWFPSSALVALPSPRRTDGEVEQRSNRLSVTQNSFFPSQQLSGNKDSEGTRRTELHLRDFEGPSTDPSLADLRSWWLTWNFQNRPTSSDSVYSRARYSVRPSEIIAVPHRDPKEKELSKTKKLPGFRKQLTGGGKRKDPKENKPNAFQDFRADQAPPVVRADMNEDWAIREHFWALQKQQSGFRLHVSLQDPVVLNDLKVKHSPAARSLIAQKQTTMPQSGMPNKARGGDKHGILHLAATMTCSTSGLMKSVDGGERASFQKELQDLKKKFKKMRDRSESNQNAMQETQSAAWERHNNAVTKNQNLMAQGAGSMRKQKQNDKGSASEAKPRIAIGGARMSTFGRSRVQQNQKAEMYGTVR